MTGVYLLNGVAYAAVVPMYPQSQAAGEVLAAGWGLALAGYPVGTLTAGVGTAWVVRRPGSASSVCAGIAAIAVVNMMFVLAGGLVGLVAVFLMLGVLDVVIEVSAGVQALQVQHRYGRWILNGCHAAESVGAIGGGLLGAVVVAAGTPLRIYLRRPPPSARGGGRVPPAAPTRPTRPAGPAGPSGPAGPGQPAGSG